jgi:hypothetical protein
MFAPKPYKSETELIDACKKHNRSAQRYLYDKYSARMYAVCLKYARSAEVAKDYLQDVDRDSFDCVVMAHTHAVGDSEKGYIRLLEQGAFADVTKMNYMDGRLTKPQKMGVAIICQDLDGNLIKDKTKVVVLN